MYFGSRFQDRNKRFFPEVFWHFCSNNPRALIVTGATLRVQGRMILVDYNREQILHGQSRSGGRNRSRRIQTRQMPGPVYLLSLLLKLNSKPNSLSSEGFAGVDSSCGWQPLWHAPTPACHIFGFHPSMIIYMSRLVSAPEDSLQRIIGTRLRKLGAV